MTPTEPPTTLEDLLTPAPPPPPDVPSLPAPVPVLVRAAVAVRRLFAARAAIATRLRRPLLGAAVLCAVLLAAVGVRDTGLATGTYAVSADFADAAGLAPNSEVAYRGVRVGRVVALRPLADGVRAELALDTDVQVPAATRAIVTTRRAIGGRYLDLRPDSGAAPYLRDGDDIPRARTGSPVPLERLLLNLGALAGSVNQDDLTVLVDELARALDGTGPALADLLDAQSTLLADAEQSLPQTIALLRESRAALTRTAATAGALRSFAGAMAAVSKELRTSGGLLRAGTDATAAVTGLLRGLGPSLGFLVGNLVVTGQVQGRRLGGLQQILVSYPAVVAQGLQVAPGDGTAHLGLVVDPGAAPPCTYAKGAHTCAAPPRGADKAPRPAGPEPSGTAHTAPPTPAAPAADPDGAPLLLGATGGQASVLGAASWKALLLGPLSL